MKTERFTIVGEDAYLDTSKGRLWIDARNIPLLRAYYLRVRSRNRSYEVRSRRSDVSVYTEKIVGGKRYRRRMALYRLFMPSLHGFMIDHINHDTLDNRMRNLRLCTPAENSRNKIGNPSRRKARYKGVYSSGQRWRACIMKNGKTIHLGTHDTQEYAALAYNDAAKKHHGKFAYLNEIPASVNHK